MLCAIKTKTFEKSLKKLKSSGQLKEAIKLDIERIINLLENEEKLPIEYRDHALTGDYIGQRECHIRGDLLLIYKIQKDQLVLVLVDIGTHSYLFG